MSLFQRFITIDWSGAKSSPDLAVAEISARELRADDFSWPDVLGCVVDGKRSREDVRVYLEEKLARDEPRTLVMVDAGFAYPYGTARAFSSDENAQPTWRALVGHIASKCRAAHSPRAAAQSINDDFGAEENPDQGPFRTNKSRNAPDFYASHNVGYFRQVEMLTPQSISQFYLGSGAAVGFSTISFLETLDSLMNDRDDGSNDAIDFDVWVHETINSSGNKHLNSSGDKHLIAETYPALFKTRFEEQWPKDDDFEELNGHERDAVACLHWLRSLSDEELDDFLHARECVVGRHKDCATWQEQLESEGWILGVPWPGD